MMIRTKIMVFFNYTLFAVRRPTRSTKTGRGGACRCVMGTLEGIVATAHVVYGVIRLSQRPVEC